MEASASQSEVDEATQEDGDTQETGKPRSLKPLVMIYREAAKYPREVVFALIALLVTAASTLAIAPAAQLIVDRGFGASGEGAGDIARWFRYLGLLVIVIALGTAARYYFVSWIGERVVADIRARCTEISCACRPRSTRSTAPKRSPAG